MLSRYIESGNEEFKGTAGEHVPFMAKVGGVRVAPGSFNGIPGLSAPDEYLFMEDGLNALAKNLVD